MDKPIDLADVLARLGQLERSNRTLRVVALLPALLLGIVVLLGMQGPPQGEASKPKQPITPRAVVEGDAFRLVRDGKTLWEMVPTEDGSVWMTFSPGGKQVCKLAFTTKVVSCRCDVGGTVSNLVIAEGAYGNSVSVDDGKVVTNRTIQRREQDQQCFCADIMTTNYKVYNKVQTQVTPDTAGTEVMSGICEAALELSAEKAVLRANGRDEVKLNVSLGDPPRNRTSRATDEVALELSGAHSVLRAKVRNDVRLDVRVGDAEQGITCLGSLIAGFAIDLANKFGSWSWANKK